MDHEPIMHTVNAFLALVESIYWKRGTGCGRTFPLHWELWTMLLQRHIQPMQTSTQPLCSLSPTYIPWGSQWDWNSAFTSCFICVQSWNFSISLADVMKVSCLGYQKLSWDTSWCNVFICHSINTQGPGWVSLEWMEQWNSISLPYLHSLSPPEYFDPSKWTWTKVLDWAAATQEFPIFRSLSASDLSEFWGITWFCCWWCLFCTVWELEVSLVIPCLSAGWAHPEEQSWDSPHCPIPLYRKRYRKQRYSHLKGIQAMRLGL